MSISKESFGNLPDGHPVMLYRLIHPAGIEATISDYGGIVVSLIVPDRHGRMEDIVLGFDRLEDYFDRSPYFGAIIGRYGNRIDRGELEIDGQYDYHNDRLW